jgi:hypothetical protein
MINTIDNIETNGTKLYFSIRANAAHYPQWSELQSFFEVLRNLLFQKSY